MYCNKKQDVYMYMSQRLSMPLFAVPALKTLSLHFKSHCTLYFSNHKVVYIYFKLSHPTHGIRKGITETVGTSRLHKSNKDWDW